MLTTIVWLDTGLTIHSNIKALALNLLPCGAFVLGLWLILRRAILSLLVSVALVFLLYHASAIKNNYLGTPLLPSDFWIVSQVMQNPDLFAGYVDITATGIAACALCVLGICLLWRYEPKTLKFPRLPSLVLAAISLLICYAVFVGGMPTQGLYAEQFGNKAKGIWSPTKLYMKSGMINGLGFFAAQAKRAVGTPDMAMLERFDNANSGELKRRRNIPLPAELPDIYLIQSESLFDPGTIRGLDHAQLMPNWHRLSQEGIHGALKSPAFGGVTIRAEFESMTGYSMHAFPTVQYPYYGLVRKGINSLPAALASFGYSTTVAHPYKPGFWNRKVVMQRFGFQHLLFQDELGHLETAGRYASDDAFFRRLLELPSTSQPRFVFAITMENHGPWLKQKVPIDTQVSNAELLDTLPPDSRKELEAYLWHVSNGDQALEMFATKLLSRSRATVLAIYGDHLPALKKTYPHVEFVDGKPAHSQPIPFMIISNRPITPRLIEHGSISELPALLLQAANLPQPGYFAIDGLVSDRPGITGKHDPGTLLMQAAWRDYRAGKSGVLPPRRDQPVGTHTLPQVKNHAISQPASLTVSPMPSAGCAPGAYTALVQWSVPASAPTNRIEIHVNQPNGDLMSSKKSSHSSAKTGNWVKPGTVFYLVDGDTGKTLASVTAGSYRCP